MRVKYIQDEVYQDYKKPSMLIAMCYCNWKCCIEENFDNSICQNSSLSQQSIIDIENENIINRYINNPLTKAIVFGGLEPLLQWSEIKLFITEFRKTNQDDIVIYTGYYPCEIEKEIVENLKSFKNIIIKWGRFIPNKKEKYDKVLGVTLISDNQYGEKL